MLLTCKSKPLFSCIFATDSVKCSIKSSSPEDAIASSMLLVVPPSSDAVELKTTCARKTWSMGTTFRRILSTSCRLQRSWREPMVAMARTLETKTPFCFITNGKSSMDGGQLRSTTTTRIILGDIVSICLAALSMLQILSSLKDVVSGQARKVTTEPTLGFFFNRPIPSQGTPSAGQRIATANSPSSCTRSILPSSAIGKRFSGLTNFFSSASGQLFMIWGP
mmetsp:Transcript_33652/g.81582  ORF Transcript_33652/g.81582 Transcript_33652/m.81582 type:complete len:222 (+) Transcript_33652:908-1573(+)